MSGEAIPAQDRYARLVGLPRAKGIVTIMDLVPTGGLLRYPRMLKSDISIAAPVEHVWAPNATDGGLVVPVREGMR